MHRGSRTADMGTWPKGPDGWEFVAVGADRPAHPLNAYGHRHASATALAENQPASADGVGEKAGEARSRP